MPGTLVYNRVVYRDVWMRFDLFRNELTVISLAMPFPIVLNNEKFDYAVLNESTIVLTDGGKKSKKKFVELLKNGNYPVVRQYNVTRTETKTSDNRIINSFRNKKQYAICINDIPHTVKNKNAVLKLFPDKRKELNAFAKLHKLNFKYQTAQFFIDIVNHYESLTNM